MVLGRVDLSGRSLHKLHKHVITMLLKLIKYCRSTVIKNSKIRLCENFPSKILSSIGFMFLSILFNETPK